MKSLRGYMEQRRRLVDTALEEFFPGEAKQPQRLFEAVRYSLFSGGKRIRPILLLAAAEAVGGEVRSVLPVACAVEMIHTYSLIHDDLPAMDDDSLRRGKPTSHVLFGEGLAILAGDALLTEAFRVLADSAVSAPSPRRAIRAMREIAEAAGANGMVGGQAADMGAEGTVADLATVEFIHLRKTAALITASVRAGAMLGGGRAGQIRSLTRYGESLGLAFQVADDILDAEGSTMVTGKLRGRDSVRRKATYPAVLGLPAAKERACGLVDRAIAELAAFAESAEPLRDIARFIVGRACDVPGR